MSPERILLRLEHALDFEVRDVLLLEKGLTPKICRLCFVIKTISLLFNLLCVWILL